jgi:hypothetical protein
MQPKRLTQDTSGGIVRQNTVWPELRHNCGVSASR